MKEFTRRIKEFTIKFIKDSDGNMFLTKVLKKDQLVYEFVNEENKSIDERLKEHNINITNLLKYKYDIIDQYLEGDNNKSNSLILGVAGIVLIILSFIINAPLLTGLSTIGAGISLFSLLKSIYKNHEEKLDLDIIEHTIDYELEQVNKITLIKKYGEQQAYEIIEENKAKTRVEKEKQAMFSHNGEMGIDYSYYEENDLEYTKRFIK